MPRARFEYGIRFVITFVMGIVILIGGGVLTTLGGWENFMLILGTSLFLSFVSFSVSYLNYLAYQSDVKAEKQKDDKIAELQKELDDLKAKNL